MATFIDIITRRLVLILLLILKILLTKYSKYE